MKRTAPVLLGVDREAENNPAYLCGRLASVLEDLELAATGDRTAWYQLFPQAIANGAIVLRWADPTGRVTTWLTKLDAVLASHYLGEITRLTTRIGNPGTLAGAGNGNWVTLGYHHQQAASQRTGHRGNVLLPGGGER